MGLFKVYLNMSLQNENGANNGQMLTLDGGLDGKYVFSTNDCIGKGSFGTIFSGRDMRTYAEVAIKVEPITAMRLLREYRNYKILGAHESFHKVQGLPEVYYIGTMGLKYTAMAMELLGPSLYKLFTRCGNIFSLKTVLMIANQVITRIEYMHDRKLIHRDIKPENLAIGRPQRHKESTENTIYLIDIGIAKLYVDPVTGTHVPFSRQAGVFGTYQFMSANSHANIEQSRRDDLESLGYILLYFINGNLPWAKSIEDENKFDLNKCEEIKRNITVKSLCNGLPEEFAMYFNYVKKLDFYEEPDYKMLKMLFNSVYVQNKFPEDNLYDWSTI